MPSATRRRPPQPQPQTRRCRFEGRHGRCTSIATSDGFCGRHLEEIAADVATPTLGESILNLFAGTPRQQRKAQEHVVAGLGQFFQQTIDRRFPPPGAGAPPAGGHVGPGPAGPARPRVSPEAIERRKRQIAARATLGFEPDEPLTVDAIRKRRQELMRVWHTDKAAGAPDPTREKMVRQINAATEFLLAHVAPSPPQP